MPTIPMVLHARVWFGLATLPLLGAVAHAQAQSLGAPEAGSGAWLPDWQITGSVNNRFDTYGLQGDPSQAPLGATGGNWISDLNVGFLRRVSAEEKIAGQVTGTLNESDHRGNERGLIVQRAKLSWEKGDAPIPFRVDGGDFFAYQSLRTLQRQLRGVQVELQPASGLGRRQSFLLSAGNTNPIYRHFGDPFDAFTSLGWLVEDTPLGTFNLTTTHDNRAASAFLPGIAQTVSSLAWLREFRQSWQRLTIEAERAWFNGDHDSASGVRDAGHFLSAQGRLTELPLNYQLRWERYGQNFRPAGAAVAADSDQRTAQVTWRFSGGQSLLGRVQQSRDGWDSGREVRTDTRQLSFNGPLSWVQGLAVSADATQQVKLARDASIDQRSNALRLNFSQALRDNWGLTWGASGTWADSAASSSSALNRDLFAAVQMPLDWSGWRGNASIGATRHESETGGVGSRSLSPSVMLSASRGRDSLSVSYAITQLHAFGGGIDSFARQTALSWARTEGRYRYGLDLDATQRLSPVTIDTKAWRLGAFFNVSFDKPMQRSAGASPAADASAAGFDFGSLAPGLALERARQMLQSGRMTALVAQGPLLVSESQVLESIALRQRLAIRRLGDAIASTTVVIDLNAGDSANTVQRNYERLQEALVRRYGAPSLNSELGVFSANLAADLQSGAFRRVMEWRTPAGVVRFGLPRRLDGIVRFEIQLAESFGASPESGRWSVEELGN